MRLPADISDRLRIWISERKTVLHRVISDLLRIRISDKKVEKSVKDRGCTSGRINVEHSIGRKIYYPILRVEIRDNEYVNTHNQRMSR